MQFSFAAIDFHLQRLEQFLQAKDVV